MFYETVSFSSKNIKDSNFATVSSSVINTTTIPTLSKEDLKFYKNTQEALDNYDGSRKGMSKEEFLKELDSW